MTLQLSEVHKFRGSEVNFAYLVPSGGIVALDGISSAILNCLERTPLSRESLIEELVAEGHQQQEIEESIDELQDVRAIQMGERVYEPSQALLLRIR